MRGAAVELGISHTVISRHIANLESWLGTKVVVASPRGVQLTREGELYSRRLATAFSLISEATSDLKPQSFGQTLRIWCVSGVATYWLAPRLQAMQDILPDSEIVLRAFERAPGFDETNADVIIGYSPSGEIPKGALTLITPRIFPVASPAWIEKNKPANLESVARSNLLHEEDRKQWTTWLTRAGVDVGKGIAGPLLWDANLCIDAAIAGQGVALASNLTAGPLVERGKLRELFKTDVRLGTYYFLAAPKQARFNFIKRLGAWLQTELEASET